MPEGIAKPCGNAFNVHAMSALPKRYFTPEEYLLLEDQADYKSQYVAGEILAMAGAEPEHVEITDNLTAALRTRFRCRPCRSYSTDMRVRIPPGELWTYPDVAALCGDPRFDRSSGPGTLLNPQVIFEVLSPSTESFDRGEKLVRYRMLDSLTDYILVSVNRMLVEHHALQPDASWTLRTFDQPTQTLSLASVDCTLPLSEIYERVDFPAPRPLE